MGVRDQGGRGGVGADDTFCRIISEEYTKSIRDDSERRLDSLVDSPSSGNHRRVLNGIRMYSGNLIWRISIAYGAQPPAYRVTRFGNTKHVLKTHISSKRLQNSNASSTDEKSHTSRKRFENTSIVQALKRKHRATL